MDLGTGIFLSTALLAIVLLYGFTKDRWRWRKIVVRMLFFGLILIAGSSAVLALAHYWDELFPTQLGRQMEYAGLKLGMSPLEVMYIKGYPPIVLEEEVDPAWKGFLKVTKTKELEQGKQAADFKHWSYEQHKSNLNVALRRESSRYRLQCAQAAGDQWCEASGGDAGLSRNRYRYRL
jgi:hypothetical protein